MDENETRLSSVCSELSSILHASLKSFGSSDFVGNEGLRLFCLYVGHVNVLINDYVQDVFGSHIDLFTS